MIPSLPEQRKRRRTLYAVVGAAVAVLTSLALFCVAVVISSPGGADAFDVLMAGSAFIFVGLIVVGLAAGAWHDLGPKP